MNLIWAIALLAVLALSKNQSIPQLFKTKDKPLPTAFEDIYSDPTNEQLQNHLEQEMATELRRALESQKGKTDLRPVE